MSVFRAMLDAFPNLNEFNAMSLKFGLGCIGQAFVETGWEKATAEALCKRPRQLAMAALHLPGPHGDYWMERAEELAAGTDEEEAVRGIADARRGDIDGAS